MVVALIHTGEVNITRWLPYLPCRGQLAQSKQRRVSRWLHNARINVHRLYKPLIKAALSTWQEDCLYLSLDTSLFWDEYCRRAFGCGASRASIAPGVAGFRTQQCLGVL
jgi:hypothetical protein